MNTFQYVSAGSPDEAISLVGKNGRYLGGGIDLLGEMKDYIVSPDVLVSLKDMAAPDSHPNLDTISRNLVGNMSASPSYIIGALVVVAEIAANEDLKKDLPGLAEAASEVGSPQIRNVATLAGNLLQHSRCLYYRQPDITCLKRGGTTCYAQEGENKYSSLFSGCACITAFTSNLGVMLTALDAKPTVLRLKNNAHSLNSMTELYHGAWKDPAAHNSLVASDFLMTVSIPTTRTRSAYRQVSEKSEFDWALVSCAAAGNVTNGTITNARVVLGAVAPIPYMVDAANQFLEGKSLTDDVASQAADIVLKDAKPLEHNGYKVPVAHALIRRTLLALNP